MCMKCQILFSQKNKKNIINLSSAEFALRKGNVKVQEQYLEDSSLDLLSSLPLLVGPDLGLSSLKETICIKCQILFSEKDTKNISSGLLKILPSRLNIKEKYQMIILDFSIKANSVLTISITEVLQIISTCTHKYLRRTGENYPRIINKYSFLTSPLNFLFFL